MEDRRGFHPAITRAISRAFSPSVIPGNSRRNSLPADNSPSYSKAVLIAAASASDTQNIAYILTQIATCRASAAYPVVPARVRKSIGDDPDSAAEPLPATITIGSAAACANHSLASAERLRFCGCGKFSRPCFRFPPRLPISGQMMTEKNSRSALVSLTRIDQGTGAPYVRPTAVTEEIETILALPLHEAFRLASSGHLRPQTLVYLMRNFRPNKSNQA
jgi:hypothetical protein